MIDLGRIMHKAAATSKIGTITRLLKKGFDINSHDADGWTVLHDAARFGNLATVRLLLRRGATLDMKGQGVPSPLELAASYNGCDVLLFLLRHGAGRNKMLLQRAIGCAANSGNSENVTLLVKWGAKYTLKEAVLLGDIDTVKLLIRKGADPHALIDGYSALMYAVTSGLWRGYIESMIDLFLLHGVDIDTRSDDSKTALILAVLQERPEIIEMLLARGSDITLKDKSGKTAFDYARNRWCADTLRGVM